MRRAGTPAAKLVAIAPGRRTRRDSLRGMISLEHDWDSPAVNSAIAEELSC